MSTGKHDIAARNSMCTGKHDKAIAVMISKYSCIVCGSQGGGEWRE